MRYSDLMSATWVRRRAILCISLLVLIGFPAQGANKKKEPVYLAASVQVSENSPKIEWRANSLVAKKFFQDNPDIKFKTMSNLRLPPGMDVQGADVTMSMVGDSAQDTFLMLSQTFPKQAEQGFLMPLDEYVKTWPEAKERLRGPVRELCSAKGPDGKKHIYALPWCVSTDCLMYSRKRFREVGLKRPPSDWNELFEYGKKLYDAEIDPETQMPKHWGIQINLEGWFVDRLPPYAGGTFWKPRTDGSYETLINSVAGVRSLDMLKKFCWEPWTDSRGNRIKGVMNRDYILAMQGGGVRAKLNIEGKTDLYSSGVIGMSFTGLWQWFNEREAKDPEIFGICQFPKYPGPEGRYINKLGGQLIGIRSTIKDKRVADAAWKLATYLCGDEGEREKTRIFVENGVARYVNPALLRKYGYSQKVIDQVPKDWAKAYDELFKTAYAPIDPPGLTAIENELAGPCRQLVRDEHMNTKKELDRVQEVVARSYLFKPTPKEMLHYRKIALVVVLGLLALMISGGVLILRTQLRENLAEEREKVYTRKVPRSKHIMAWCLLTPACLSVFLWQYVPVAWGSVMAFLKVQIVGGGGFLGGSQWVGLDNFINVAVRPLYWLAWKNTVIYVGMSLTMGFAAPIILALLLSEIPKGKTLFRTLYYLPALTTGVVTLILWMRFYDGTQYGLMNRMLMAINTNVLTHINQVLAFAHLPLKIPVFGLQQWLADPKLAMACCILPSIWAGMGPGCIIYLAALKAVPEEQYDAADLDGAGMVQKARHITLPTIFPLVLINFVGSFIGAFHGGGNILVMTGGGPNHATHVMNMEIFYQGFVLANYGQTTAIAWTLASLLVGFAVLQMKIFARMKFSTAEQQGE